jgi:hypothetical protein
MHTLIESKAVSCVREYRNTRADHVIYFIIILCDGAVASERVHYIPST